MEMAREDDVTGWLVAWGHGDATADGRLMAAVYEDLRRVARRRLRAERAEHSLAPTALVFTEVGRGWAHSTLRAPRHSECRRHAVA